MLAGLLTLISQVGYLLACWYLSYHLPYDPTAGINAPKYLLGNIDPTILLFFQWATLLVLFDAVHRHERNRITEVLDTKPSSNLEAFTGRTIAVAGIIWAVVVLNIFIMQLIGSFSIFGWHYAESLQWHSVVNLILIDGPVNLMFWISFLVLLGVILRTRILVLLIGGSAMFGWYWLLIRSPYSLLSLFSPSSNDTIFVSELVPRLLSVDAALVRISCVLFAAFFLVSAALLRNRLDGISHHRVNLGLLPTCFALALATCLVGVWGVLTPFKEYDRWKTVHTAYEWVDDIDIQRISGEVHIDPNKTLATQFVINLVRQSGARRQPLVFTLNPGMKIQSVAVGGALAEHNFDNGLLEIRNVNIEIGVPFDLAINARGKPLPNFAYFDSVVNYLTDRDVPAHSVKLFGRDGTIFHSSYVGLMPGAHWYPTPGPVNAESGYVLQGRDFFAVDLTVSVKPKNWSLVASTSFLEKLAAPNTYSVRSSDPVPEIGLFASRFKRATIEIGGIQFSMNLHAKHSENLSPITDWNDTMLETAEGWIEEYQHIGLPTLNSEIHFVEVPRSLRTVGGGWRMDAVNTLPGLVLLKEHGYPRAKRQLAVERYLKPSALELDETAELLAPLRLLNFYFQRGNGTDVPWTDLNKHLWVHHTSPAGEYAPILDQIVNWIIATHNPRLNRQFSIYSTMHISNLTMLQFIAGAEGFADAVSVDEGILSAWYLPTAARIEQNYFDRSSIWSHIENSGKTIVHSTNGHQKHFEALLLKSREIASALLKANSRKRVYQWINEVRTQYQGRQFTYNDFIKSAQAHEIDYEPFLTDWITKGTLPAFLVHEPNIRQIANNEHGEVQYQTTFVLQNTQPVMGFVRVRVPSEQTVGRFPSRTYSTAHSLRVEGNSILRVNVQTHYRISSLTLDLGLSLNREQRYVDVVELANKYDPNLQPSPITEVIEAIDQDNSIIVDDLDKGFQVHQQLPSLKSTPRFGPVAWFSYLHGKIELDAGLPIDSPQIWSQRFSNIWHRASFLGFNSMPFGRYRQTAAIVRTQDQAPPEVAFTTKLTRDGDWRLDYHYPWDMGDEFGTWWMPEDDSVSLEIVQGEKNHEAPLRVRTMFYGWNKIGTYNLKSEDVSVNILYRPKPKSESVRIYADAIRWTPIDEPGI